MAWIILPRALVKHMDETVRSAARRDGDVVGTGAGDLRSCCTKAWELFGETPLVLLSMIMEALIRPWGGAACRRIAR